MSDRAAGTEGVVRRASRMTVCACEGDRKPGTKRCTRWADPNREDGLCSACAREDAYCREFR